MSAAERDDRSIIIALSRRVRAVILGVTGRQYRIDLEALDATSLHELMRLVREADRDKQEAVERARPPWHRDE